MEIILDETQRKKLKRAAFEICGTGSNCLVYL